MAGCGILLCEGIVLAEFAASFQWQLYAWWVIKIKEHNVVISILAMLVVYSIIFVLYFFIQKNHIPKEGDLNVTSKEFCGAVFIAMGAFAISNLTFVMPDTPFSSAASSIFYVRTLVDFGGLVMLFAQQDKREELRMRSENQAMTILLQRQYDQYRLAQDNRELLRREFHDLKHYMIAIRSEKDPEQREVYLQEMENAILTQEALTNTGNQVLDVMLTTKSIYCMQNHITFNCMADGKLIGFMHVKDICSIFGNALDNAIECAMQQEGQEKRLITLTMTKKNHFVMIQFKNYAENISTIKNDLPETTKSNKLYHGFGLKSIKYAVQKYEGTMTVHSDNHWFTLQILIPLIE